MVSNRNRPELRRDCDGKSDEGHYEVTPYIEIDLNYEGIATISPFSIIVSSFFFYRNRPELRRDCDRG